MALSFEAIREVHRQEKVSKKLTKLPEGFYREAGEYIRLKSSRKDPLALLEVENAKMVINDIIDRREHKIVEAAMIFARSGIVPENLSPEEEEMFSELADKIKSHRERLWKRILGHVDGTEETKEESNGMTGADEPETNVEPEDEEEPEDEAEEIPRMEEKAEIFSPVKEEKPNWKEVYLVLKNLPLFIWSDGRRYSLKEGDAVRLPEELAAFLLEKGVLKPVDG